MSENKKPPSFKDAFNEVNFPGAPPQGDPFWASGLHNNPPQLASVGAYAASVAMFALNFLRCLGHEVPEGATEGLKKILDINLEKSEPEVRGGVTAHVVADRHVQTTKQILYKAFGPQVGG